MKIIYCQNIWLCFSIVQNLTDMQDFTLGEVLEKLFTWGDLIKVKIPIADIAIQKDIVDIFTVYKERKSINDKLKAQIKDICPILIKGSIEEARKEA